MLFQNGMIFFVIAITYVIVSGVSQTARPEGTVLQISNSVGDFWYQEQTVKVGLWC